MSCLKLKIIVPLCIVVIFIASCKGTQAISNKTFKYPGVLLSIREDLYILDSFITNEESLTQLLKNGNISAKKITLKLTGTRAIIKRDQMNSFQHAIYACGPADIYQEVKYKNVIADFIFEPLVTKSDSLLVQNTSKACLYLAGENQFGYLKYKNTLNILAEIKIISDK